MELNREQIIKALEIHTGGRNVLCEECPYDHISIKEVCIDVLMKDALSLIKGLTEENERVRAERDTLEIYNKDYKYRLKGLRKDNEEWEEQCKDLELDNDILRERITEVKADTVRKMQERLTAEFRDRVAYTRSYCHDTIDQIAKEMLEDDKMQ